MSKGPNHAERYQQERAYARFVRKQQGRTTALDRAETRHDRLWRTLLAARFFAPAVISCGIALSAGSTLLDCWAIIMWMLGTNFVAVIAGGLLGSIFGSGVGELIYNALMTLGGFILLLAPGAPPVMVAISAVLAASPAVWWFGSRALMSNTDYVRLMRESSTDDVPPRIIE